MKTTLEIADPLLRAARSLARRRGTTLRALVEAGLRKVDPGVVVEPLRKIGEEVCEELSLSALGTEQMGEDNPGVRTFHVDMATIHCCR